MNTRTTVYQRGALHLPVFPKPEVHRILSRPGADRETWHLLLEVPVFSIAEQLAIARIAPRWFLRSLYNRRLLHHFVDTLIQFGPVGVFLVGLLESFGVPIPAVLDSLLFSLAWKTPASAYVLAACAVLGSLAGNIALFQTSRQGGRKLMKAPPPDAPQKFRKWFQRYGLVTVFIPALVPIPLPLKVFVISAGLFHTPFRNFIGVIVVARVVRYFGLAYLGAQIGGDGAAFLKQNIWSLVGISVGLAVALYVLVRFNDRRNAVTHVE